MKAYEISRIGEKLVHKLLSGSIWINKKNDNHLYYDILWKEKKIDVKTTTVKVRWYRLGELSNEYFNFSQAGRDFDKKIIIFVAIDVTKGGEYKYYFWVDKHFSNGLRRNVNKSIGADKLSECLL